jgi:hypothetical protein
LYAVNPLPLNSAKNFPIPSFCSQYFGIIPSSFFSSKYVLCFLFPGLS